MVLGHGTNIIDDFVLSYINAVIISDQIIIGINDFRLRYVMK